MLDETVLQEQRELDLGRLEELRLFLSAQCGLPVEAFLSLHQHLGVDSLYDLVIVRDEDLDSLPENSFPILRRRKLRHCICSEELLPLLPFEPSIALHRPLCALED